jgi:hypothetical protein
MVLEASPPLSLPVTVRSTVTGSDPAGGRLTIPLGDTTSALLDAQVKAAPYAPVAGSVRLPRTPSASTSSIASTASCTFDWIRPVTSACVRARS